MISQRNTRLLGLMTMLTLALHADIGRAGAPKEGAGAGRLDELECRTLLRLGGDDRAFTLLYFHGFVSGKTNLMRLEVEPMAAVTDRVVDHCIDHPGDKLLPVFERYRSGK